MVGVAGTREEELNDLPEELEEKLHDLAEPMLRPGANPAAFFRLRDPSGIILSQRLLFLRRELRAWSAAGRATAANQRRK